MWISPMRFVSCLAHFIRASGKHKTVSTAYTVCVCEVHVLDSATLYNICVCVCVCVSFFRSKLWIVASTLGNLFIHGFVEKHHRAQNHTSIVEYHTIHSENLSMSWGLLIFFSRLAEKALAREPLVHRFVHRNRRIFGMMLGKSHLISVAKKLRRMRARAHHHWIRGEKEIILFSWFA